MAKCFPSIHQAFRVLRAAIFNGCTSSTLYPIFPSHHPQGRVSLNPRITVLLGRLFRTVAGEKQEHQQGTSPASSYDNIARSLDLEDGGHDQSQEPGPRPKARKFLVKRAISVS